MYSIQIADSSFSYIASLFTVVALSPCGKLELELELKLVVKTTTADGKIVHDCANQLETLTKIYDRRIQSKHTNFR